MLNLSRFPLRNAHINLLSKRPKFSPKVSRSNLNLKSNSKGLTRKLKCRENFGISNLKTTVYGKLTLFIIQLILARNLAISIKAWKQEPIKPVNNNLSKEEQNTQTGLTNNPNTVIQKADSQQ